jgi:hypothetical protein
LNEKAAKRKNKSIGKTDEEIKTIPFSEIKQTKEIISFK